MPEEHVPQGPQTKEKQHLFVTRRRKMFATLLRSNSQALAESSLGGKSPEEKQSMCRDSQAVLSCSQNNQQRLSLATNCRSIARKKPTWIAPCCCPQCAPQQQQLLEGLWSGLHFLHVSFENNTLQTSQQLLTCRKNQRTIP